MLYNRIIYTCKKCGWQGSILKEWEDIKPKFCLNKRCKTSFLLHPEELDIKLPEVVTDQVDMDKVEDKPSKKSKKEKNA